MYMYSYNALSENVLISYNELQVLFYLQSNYVLVD